MKLAAIMLVFKEQHFLKASLEAVYPHVDALCCATMYDRNLKGSPVAPDHSLETLLAIPDPQNKLRLVLQRDVSARPGSDAAARLRNAAMDLAPEADYFLIIDSDEIWTAETLQKAWAEVQRTRHAGYRISSHTYFKTWNHRVVEPGEGYRPFVFLRKGFLFDEDRQIDWKGPARLREYLRTGRKPKTVYFPQDWRMHHGSCVGGDDRILTKLKNYSHADLIDPTWFDRIWKNFSPDIKNFHYYPGTEFLYESLITIPHAELPPEITSQEWPEGWILK
ncbi:MAG: glycosyltransferase family A protein [Verrucomicrobiae bacterium]|nr:glycosyltransferase family A protein [Verrucomicrobiae bacterium]